MITRWRLKTLFGHSRSGYPDTNLTMASLRLSTRGLLRMRTAAAARPLSSHAMAAEEARPAVTMLDEEEVMVRFATSHRPGKTMTSSHEGHATAGVEPGTTDTATDPNLSMHDTPSPAIADSTMHRSRSLASPIRSHCTRTHTSRASPRLISPAAAPPPRRSSKTARGASRPR